jgi:hypothetical protein
MRFLVNLGVRASCCTIRRRRPGIGSVFAWWGRRATGTGSARRSKWSPAECGSSASGPGVRAIFRRTTGASTSGWATPPSVDKLTVTWPSGTVQTLDKVPADRVITIEEK